MIWKCFFQNREQRGNCSSVAKGRIKNDNVARIPLRRFRRSEEPIANRTFHVCLGITMHYRTKNGALYNQPLFYDRDFNQITPN